MSKEVVRVGRVSSVNYAEGTIAVVYSDRDGAVTSDLPLLSFEYMMPEPGDMVQVLHLSNGQEIGVCMSRFWNDTNPPPENGKGLYRKDFSRSEGKWDGKCFMKYDSATGTLTIHNDGPIKIEGSRIDLN